MFGAAQHVFQNLRAALGADALQQQQDAVPRDRVLGVGEHAQMRQHVLHVRGLDEPEAAPLHERQVVFAQFDFQVEGVEARPEQHRDFRQRDALLAELENLLRHETRLVTLAVRLDQHGLHARILLGEQVLGIALPGLHDDFVGQVENGLRAAVVFFELDDAGARKQRGKLQNIPHRGAPEAVDRLGVVAHGHDVVVRVGEQPHDVGLEPVGVLVFVHHDVAEGARQALGHVGVRVQQAAQVDQQVVVVEQAAFELVVAVVLVDAVELVQFGEQVRKLRVEHVCHAGRLVGREAQHLGDRLFARKAARLLVQPQPRTDQVDGVLGVPAVENRERVGESEQRGIAAQDGMRERMERAARHPVAPAAQQRAGAGDHLFRGAARERQQQQAARVDALLDHARDTEHERARLAAPGAGQHQHRAVAHGGRLVLAGVQFLLVVDGERAGRGVRLPLELECEPTVTVFHAAPRCGESPQAREPTAKAPRRRPRRR